MKLTFSSRETLLARIDQPAQLADQGPLFPPLGLGLGSVPDLDNLLSPAPTPLDGQHGVCASPAAYGLPLRIRKRPPLAVGGRSEMCHNRTHALQQTGAYSITSSGRGTIPRSSGILANSIPASASS